MTCAWTPDPACVTAEWEALDEAEQERALLLATSSLQTLTYNRVGSCPITIRPCPTERTCECAWSPYLGADGLWRNSCAHGRSCAPLSEIDIPGPVGYIETLLIDGVAQDLWNGDWRLDDGHLLVWQGEGDSPVPATQDLNKPDTEPGTWSITYSQSYPVLADGRLAVALLAMEFAKACKPKGKCQLPRGVTSVVRNGVSFTVEAGLWPGGLTGIDIVDQFILKWAPAGSPLRTAVVFDPRRRGPRRVNSVPRGPVTPTPPVEELTVGVSFTPPSGPSGTSVALRLWITPSDTPLTTITLIQDGESTVLDLSVFGVSTWEDFAPMLAQGNPNAVWDGTYYTETLIYTAGVTLAACATPVAGDDVCSETATFTITGG